MQKQFMAEILAQRNVTQMQTDQPQIKINTALVPNFESFDSKKESFANYKNRFQNYIGMKNVAGDQGYCAKLFLNSIGAESFNIISALVAPKLPSDFQFDELLKTIEEYLAPKKNVLVAQHEFLSTYQKDNQPIIDFVTELRADIGSCDFVSRCACKSSIADTFLRAQFIRGLSDNGIREQLLQMEFKDFNGIMSRAIALESSKKNARELAQRSTQFTSVPEINKVSNFRKQSESSKQEFQHRNTSYHQGQERGRINYRELGIDGLCLRCGRGNHLVRDCRCNQDSLRCEACNKTGHVRKVCIRELLQRKTSKTTNTHQIREEEEEDDSLSYGINQIIDIHRTTSGPGGDTGRFHADVKVQGQKIRFEIDSGSAYTFLPRNLFSMLKPTAKLETTNVGFRSYTKNIFFPDGKATVNIEFNNRKVEEELYVVPEEFTALLGRSWIRKLHINLNDIDSDQPGTTINSIEGKELLENIEKEFPEIFKERIGCIPKFEINLKLRDEAKPIFFKEREIPYALKAKVEEELNSLETAGIISKTDTSDWGSPLVVIPKEDGGVRLCVDYKVGVNERLIDAHYPIRKIEEVLNSLHNSKYFCRLDLYKAYLHIPVDATSSEIQTITTHRGTYRMNRLSFGIKTAPAEFNRIMDQMLRNIPKTEVYFDDIIVHGETKEECERNLRLCLGQLCKFDLHLNKRKCSFFQQQIEVLGHVVEHNRIIKSPSKIRAIEELPRPQSVEDVRTLLGMTTYYARFIPRASTITAPLRSLLVKNAKFHWSTKCEEALLELKKEILSDRVLVPYNPQEPVQLACDASPVGIGAVFSHIIDGQERPIAFASRALTAAERNYSQLDREALAIVYAVDHLFQYLFGRRFTLITDNQPLARIFHEKAKIPQMTFARLQRYAAFLSGFDYVVVCKKGSDNGNADCLSRAPITSTMGAESHINKEVNELCRFSINNIAGSELTFETILEETIKDKKIERNNHTTYRE